MLVCVSEYEALVHVGCMSEAVDWHMSPACLAGAATALQGGMGAEGIKGLESRAFLVLANMEENLRTLANDLPVAPGDPWARERVRLAAETIAVRLNELKSCMDDREDAAAASESAALLS